eukprot:CAMPEP_0202390608 /NCGR_PEP_ID=MMETSP1127-20130417/89634_1 /ASSEMBLY_ACC=CAM_ASM_000462 /TAXON_ID=3047 /ORGANISM="Dunaliella tertiolecta, Strain CCMP1320" /LENGTH=126 /DNA_ID=CAMNT_0048992879 /DNA_START=217 /DNA_END=594 /DNA_ORIENTATION=+
MATAQQQIQHEQQQHGRQQQSWATTPPGGGVQGACTLGTGKDASYLEQLLRQLHIRHEQAAGLLLTCPNLLEVEPQQASMLIRSMSKLLDCTHRRSCAILAKQPRLLRVPPAVLQQQLHMLQLSLQ